jgi:hypothetical protein
LITVDAFDSLDVNLDYYSFFGQTDKFYRFIDEDKDGPVDPWLTSMVIPPRPPLPHRVAIVAYCPDPLPVWIQYFVRAASSSRNNGIKNQLI